MSAEGGEAFHIWTHAGLKVWLLTLYKCCSQGYSIVADLMDVSDAKRTIDEAVAKMGGLDILVFPGTTQPCTVQSACLACPAG